MKFIDDLREFRRPERGQIYDFETNYVESLNDNEDNPHHNPSLLIPENIKNNASIMRYVCRCSDNQIHVFERKPNNKGNLIWRDVSKNLPDWSIPFVMKLMKNWKMQ